MATISIFNARNVNGTWTSPVKLIPENLAIQPKFTFPIRADHYSDTSKQITFEIQISDNGTTGWWTKCKHVWKGGLREDKEGNITQINPSLRFFNLNSFKGKYIRLVITTNSTVNTSGEVEV